MRMPAFGPTRVSGPVRRLILVLGDQLDPAGLDALGADPERDAIAMVEVARESTHVPSHVQRTVLFLSAMRHYAADRASDGWRVEYVTLDDHDNTQSFETELARLARRLEPEAVTGLRPGERRVLDEIEAACREAGVAWRPEEDPHFTCTIDAFERWARGRKSLTMEYFYRERRKKLGILVDDDGQPEGGQWNFDKENREAFKAAPSAPDPPAYTPDDITREVIELVRDRLPGLPGKAEPFSWPVTRAQARRSLTHFIKHRLPDFGAYEDAMWTGEPTLFHSALSPAINLHLLNPRECVDAAVEAYRSGAAPLNSVEGFVRQLIGWREFIRGVYWTRYQSRGAKSNALDQHGDLPELYWTADTDMTCMRECVGSVVGTAYAHHIPRLMVMGNFAMLAGVHPQKVSDWYLGMFADGIDWVTLPNVRGMAMHADGGVVGTKPYAGSGKYISRMSNFCKRCRYDVNARSGDGACPFNVLYWDFLNRNRDAFARNTRMAMTLKNLDRIDDAELVRITTSARSLRQKLGVGAISR